MSLCLEALKKSLATGMAEDGREKESVMGRVRI